ncbi:YitT family protein [Saccharospirillum salsuginis]|uniref:Membrane protein n=1 Tax=Saccharospirillum salsuginis TaxID=418750 RepID=A0A918KR96_9GAMM|nr:YitT family protein [Saccharospirillum salsuginis]GGX72977.1 membrane protein [Saccharospirillum salsuginis]
MKQKSTHSIPEDLFALLTGALFVSFGLLLFKDQGFLTGGTAGLALIITKVSDFSFGQVFFVINLPFYWLAIRRMGWRFTINTFISVASVSVLADNLHRVISLGPVHPVFAAIMGGFMIGTGMLILFRHVSSLGGVGILALYLQDRFKLSAGRVQMGVDVAIVCIGFFLVPLVVLALSVLGALALNLVIALNHKPGRYQIT